jgi:hypothetical protein
VEREAEIGGRRGEETREDAAAEADHGAGNSAVAAAAPPATVGREGSNCWTASASGLLFFFWITEMHR